MADKEFKCLAPGCGKAFTLKRNLTRHAKTHSNIERFPCTFEDCSKTFSRKSDLKTHMNIHLKIKPFICSVCSKSFRRSSDLKIHEKRHRKQREHACPKCDKRFYRPCDLRVHETRVHGTSIDEQGTNEEKCMSTLAAAAQSIQSNCPWKDCSCGSGCSCEVCSCGTVAKSQEDWLTEIFDSSSDALTVAHDEKFSQFQKNITESLKMPLESITLQQLQESICPWKDCSCGIFCNCLSNCSCGTTTKSVDEYSQILHQLHELSQ